MGEERLREDRSCAGRTQLGMGRADKQSQNPLEIYNAASLLNQNAVKSE